MPRRKRQDLNMKTKGVIRGMNIELEALTDFPDGQVVAVEISLPAAREDVAGTADQSGSDPMEAAAELRQRIAERLGGNLDCSARYVREDRER